MPINSRDARLVANVKMLKDSMRITNCTIDETGKLKNEKDKKDSNIAMFPEETIKKYEKIKKNEEKDAEETER